MNTPTHKTQFGQLVIRLRVCWRILSQEYGSWVLLSPDDKNMHALLDDKPDVTVRVSYHRMQWYNVMTLLRVSADAFTPEDLILGKAQFEAEAELQYPDKEQIP